MMVLEGIILNVNFNIPDGVIDKAVENATLSQHQQKHGAVIFKGKRIYSVGYNQPSRSVKSINKKAQKWATSVHAEVACILNAKRDVSGLDILVVRVNSKHQFSLSKPCIKCLTYLEYCGIRNIYYSIISYPFIERL